MRFVDDVATLEIGGRPSHSQQPLDAPRTPTFHLCQSNRVRLFGRLERASGAKGSTTQPRVEAAAPAYLAPPGPSDAAGDRR
jgi:hypothetical protein